MTDTPGTELATANLTQGEKVAHILDRRRQGIPFARIGDELGMTKQGANDLYWKAMEARIAPNAAQIRAEQNERLDYMFERAAEIEQRKHVMVSGGTVVKDEDGEPLIDDGPQLRALAEMRAIEAERAKLNGTYAPVQATINGEVRYEVAGIDLGLLR